MSTDKARELLIGHLYGELSPEEERELERRLGESAELGEELERLRAARQALSEARPSVPAALPRVVLYAPPKLRHPWFAFAAGFACAALLLAAGAVAGWGFAAREPGPRAGLDTRPAAGELRPVTSAELHQALSDYQGRLDRVNRENDELRRMLEQQTGRPVLTRDQLESELSELVRTVDRRRASDLSYILGELADMQVRTDTRIGRTQEALRYVLLSGDPRLSEQ